MGTDNSNKGRLGGTYYEYTRILNAILKLRTELRSHRRHPKDKFLEKMDGTMLSGLNGIEAICRAILVKTLQKGDEIWTR